MNRFAETIDLEPLEIPQYYKSFVSCDPHTDRLDVEYYFDQDSGHLYAKVQFGKHAQGPPNHVHSGATSAVFEEAMGAVVWANGYPRVTRWMHVNYIYPLRLGTEVLVEAWIEKHVDKVIWCYGGMWDLGGTLYADSSGLYVEQGKEHFQEMGDLAEFYIKEASEKLF